MPNVYCLSGACTACSTHDEYMSLTLMHICADDSDDANFDVYSRFFAPWVGPHEDPVTGVQSFVQHV